MSEVETKPKAKAKAKPKAEVSPKREGRRYTPSPAAPPGNEKSINELRIAQQKLDAEKRASIQETVDMVLAAIDEVPNDPVCKRAVYDAVIQRLKA